MRNGMAAQLVLQRPLSPEAVVLDFPSDACSSPCPMEPTVKTALASGVGRMEGKLLSRIELPPDVAAEIEQMRAAAKPTSTEQDKRFDESLRLQFLYHGRAVVCVPTDEGLVVVADAEPGAGQAKAIKNELPEPVRSKARIVFP